MLINRISNKIQSYRIKCEVKRKEKGYNHLRYMFYSQKASDWLIVSFSGFSGGSNANYNYIRTLRDIDANKLFLLDQYGSKVNVGSYYLGEKGEWFLIEDIVSLIENIRKEHSIKHVVMIGSSKGGASALFYSLKIAGVDAIVIGAPQYYIGDYLSSEAHLPILKAICGDDSQASIKRLNALLPSLVKVSEYRPQVFIHYSPLEHTYKEHIESLVSDLKDNGFIVIEDADYTYKDHKEVRYFYPRYLKLILHDIIK